MKLTSAVKRIFKYIFRSLVFCLAAVFVAAAVCGVLMLVQRGDLAVTEYEFSDSRITGNVRIAFLCDLHEREFGEENSRLLALVSESEPDLILLGGDMSSSDCTDFSSVCDLIEELTELAPVYYISGNHELANPQFDGQYEDSGAVSLDDRAVTLTLNGQDIAVGGISEIDFPGLHSDSGNEKQFAVLEELSESEKFSILLCHYPEYYEWFFASRDYTFELELCGHAHGGIAELPVVGRLYAPNQGFFPEYAFGLYELDHADMIVSAGLSDDYKVPRLNNPSEVVIVDILPESALTE